MTEQECQNNLEDGKDKYLIVEYQEAQNTRRAHGTDFFKAITWSAIASFTMYNLIIIGKLHPVSLWPISLMGIVMTYVICKRHKQRLIGHDTRICQLEKHFKFKSQGYYNKHVSKGPSVTRMLQILLVLIHGMVFIYGLLVAAECVPDYRDAKTEIHRPNHVR